MYIITLSYLFSLRSFHDRRINIGVVPILFFVLLAFVLVGGITFWAALSFALLIVVLNHLLHHQQLHRVIAGALGTGVFFLTLALFLHTVPGFQNELIIDNQVIGETSRTPYSLYVNYDKALAGILVLYFYCDKNQIIGDVAPKALGIMATGVLLLLVVASIWLNLQLDVKWLGEASMAFILVKSFSTAFAEEIVFRGWLQGKLQRSIAPSIALIVVSIFFGLVHFGGGLAYVLIATLAGLFYGYLFMRYNSVLLAGMAHSLVNILHFCFLTYPA